jgi:plastocyanin
MRGRGWVAVNAAAIAAVVLTVGGCSSSSKTSSAGATSAPSTTVAPTTTSTTASTAAPTGGGGTETVSLVAKGISWSTTRLHLKAGQKVVVAVSNKDMGIEHNFTFTAVKANKDVEGGESAKVAFTAPAAGTYRFFCKYHAARMHGTVTVT